jgi:hypothetical protein
MTFRQRDGTVGGFRDCDCSPLKGPHAPSRGQQGRCHQLGECKLEFLHIDSLTLPQDERFM